MKFAAVRSIKIISAVGILKLAYGSSETGEEAPSFRYWRFDSKNHGVRRLALGMEVERQRVDVRLDARSSTPPKTACKFKALTSAKNSKKSDEMGFHLATATVDLIAP